MDKAKAKGIRKRTNVLEWSLCSCAETGCGVVCFFLVWGGGGWDLTEMQYNVFIAFDGSFTL